MAKTSSKEPWMSLRGPVASNGLRQLDSEGHSVWNREAAGFREGLPVFLSNSSLLPSSPAPPPAPSLGQRPGVLLLVRQHAEMAEGLTLPGRLCSQD